VREDTKFCTGCGAPIRGAAPAQPAGPEPAATEVSAPASPYTPVPVEPGHTQAVPPLKLQPADETIPGYGNRDASDVGTPNVRAGVADDGAGIGGIGAGPGWTSPAGQPTGERFPRSRKKILVIAAVAVVVLAGGGGTLVWAASRHPRAAAVSLRHGRTAHARPTTGTSQPSVSPAQSSSSGAAPSPSSTSPAFEVAPGVAGSATAPQVEALVASYFAAINEHNYQNYVSLLAPSVSQGMTPTQFKSGYGSTTDSNMVLTDIFSAGSDSVAATVTFISRQLPADSPDSSSCDKWQITLYLQPDGGGYLIGPPPDSYHSSYRACQ
jgi:hypothetical protein